MTAHDRGAEICIERDHRGGYRQNYKTITNETMKDTGVRVAGSSSLLECVREYEFESRERLIKTSSRSAASPSSELPVKAVRENREDGQQQNIHHPDIRYVPVDLARGARGIHLCEFCKAMSFWRRSGTTFR